MQTAETPCRAGGGGARIGTECTWCWSAGQTKTMAAMPQDPALTQPARADLVGHRPGAALSNNSGLRLSQEFDQQPVRFLGQLLLHVHNGV
jgi:hypothetical protein